MSTLTWNEPRVSWDWPSRPSGFLTRFDDEYNNNYQHDDDDDDNDDDDDDGKEEKDDDKIKSQWWSPVLLPQPPVGEVLAQLLQLKHYKICEILNFYL